MTRSDFLNALSIDVEDYFMVSAFEPFVKKSAWGDYESRVVPNTRKILDMLDEFDTKGTFFTVGWVGEKHPQLVREIHDRGHEVACHGYYHQLAYQLTPEEFREDLRKTKRVLENATGAPILGYRAPSFSLVKETPWMFDIIHEEGFRYDSSVLPAAHARGGFHEASAERFPYQVNGISEFPMSTLRIAGKNFPFSGGGYFRLFPYYVTRFGISHLNHRGKPVVMYLHPWEFDPDQPRMPVKGLDRFKHYVNLHRTEKKFRQLLSDFHFSPVRDVLKKTVGMR